MRKLVVILALAAVVGAAWGDSGSATADAMMSMGQAMQSMALAMAAQGGLDYASSIDFAVPPLNDTEKTFTFNSGYIATKDPARFIFMGKYISEVEFMKRIGLEGYARDLQGYNRRDALWASSLVLSAAGLFTSILVNYEHMDDPIFATPWGYVAVGSSVGLLVSFIGGGINLAQVPQRPDFSLLAFRVNEVNRNLMKP